MLGFQNNTHLLYLSSLNELSRGGSEPFKQLRWSVKIVNNF